MILFYLIQSKSKLNLLKLQFYFHLIQYSNLTKKIESEKTFESLILLQYFVILINRNFTLNFNLILYSKQSRFFLFIYKKLDKKKKRILTHDLDSTDPIHQKRSDQRAGNDGELSDQILLENLFVMDVVIEV